MRKVTLYKHGVGYFERTGSLAAGESARIEFPYDAMNDVLKSLLVEERGGGKITGLRYDSSEAIEEVLKEFPFTLGDKQALSALLDQLKGARVELKTGADTIAGRIVAARLTAGDERRREAETVTLLLDSGDLRSVDLGGVTSVRFPDAKLQQQFKDYLTALERARSKELRGVYIDSTDARSRELSVAYMMPSPVWKSSYRLVFGAAAQPTLEGWAIVDNTTGEDWTNVQLSLVSGRPISFISALYEPKYVQRQSAELPDDEAAAPVVHKAAMAPMAPAGRAGLSVQEQVGIASAVDRFQRTESTVAVNTQTREAGELFEYRLSSAVTVRKNESAMLPFLQQKLDARKLLIYSNQASEHPTNAAELTNSTGKTLDGGPITVYDGGVYGGEALMETTKAGDKRLISYAVDLGTRITTAFDSKAAITREVHFSRGLLSTKMAAAETRTYSIKNVDAKEKTLIIEHPARPQYTLVGMTAKERTRDSYRFEVKLPPNSDQKFAVNEERVFDTTTMITNLTPDAIAIHLQNRTLTDAGRRALTAIVAKKREIAANDSALRLAQSQMTDLERDQQRTRQNIQSLNSVSGQQQQVQTYSRQLAEQEARMATLRDEIARAQQKKSALEIELNTLIADTEF